MRTVPVRESTGPASRVLRGKAGHLSRKACPAPARNSQREIKAHPNRDIPSSRAASSPEGLAESLGSARVVARPWFCIIPYILVYFSGKTQRRTSRSAAEGFVGRDARLGAGAFGGCPH